MDVVRLSTKIFSFLIKAVKIQNQAISCNNTGTSDTCAGVQISLHCSTFSFGTNSKDLAEGSQALSLLVDPKVISKCLRILHLQSNNDILNTE